MPKVKKNLKIRPKKGVNFTLPGKVGFFSKKGVELGILSKKVKKGFWKIFEKMVKKIHFFISNGKRFLSEIVFRIVYLWSYKMFFAFLFYRFYQFFCILLLEF